MANLKQRLHRKNASGSYDVIYLETTADLVKRADGVKSVESSLTEIEAWDPIRYEENGTVAPFLTTIDADTLQGHPASDFIMNGDTIDATTLGGHASSDFVLTSNVGMKWVYGSYIGNGPTVSNIAINDLDYARTLSFEYPCIMLMIYNDNGHIVSNSFSSYHEAKAFIPALTNDYSRDYGFGIMGGDSNHYCYTYMKRNTDCTEVSWYSTSYYSNNRYYGTNTANVGNSKYYYIALCDPNWTA